ncbi:hypothetical protein jhhlp_004077 [Lomentospora prolificans]|uniref:Helicase ATP-binding domain-containing protein n=1 Tax=Lomentospora prolificans TaxID=41688 RepID=A0A2N3NAM3_9PEZI|nr:hypothetical protein jhhlp_004077 [Lomentospora prolificans]
MAPKPIEDVVTEWFTKFRAIPKDVHLLCPKISEEDGEDYTRIPVDGDEKKKKRIEEGEARVETVYWSSLLLAMPKEKTEQWMKEFGDRLNEALRKCDKCVMNWHMKRKAFLTKFQEDYNEDAVREVQRLFSTLDFNSLDKGLKWAQEAIDKVEKDNNNVFKLASLADQRGPFLLVIYEALCCVPYLSLPDKRRDFLSVFYKVNAKKPLRLGTGSILPASTAFLFADDPVGLRFATTCWQTMEPGSMTSEQFDWAVNGPLSEAMNTVAALDPTKPESYPKIQQFWDGFFLILRALSEHLVTHNLAEMDVNQALYTALFHHLQFCESEAILVNLIKVISALLEKAPYAFWRAVGETKPFMVAEKIIYAPTFKRLLSQSMDICMEEVDGERPPFTVSWIYSWIRSVKRHEKMDACASLLNKLFDELIKDNSISPEGHAACARAGFDALTDVLESFLTVANAQGQFPATLQRSFVLPNNILHLNAVINMTCQFHTQLVEWAEKRSQPFDAHKAALRVIRTALELDSRTTAEEWKGIHLGKPYQTVVKRRSSDLWDGFLDLLYPGNLDQARHVLHGMFPLLCVEPFRPERKAVKPMEKSKLLFNETFDRLSGVVGTVLQRLSQFNASELDDLSRDGMKVILAFSFHGTDVIREAAIELLKAMTKKLSSSDAVIQLVHQQPSGTIRIFNYALNQTVKPPIDEGSGIDDANAAPRTAPPYGPVPHILSFGQDVLSALCDPATGLLRTASLSPSELDTVFSWWTTQWHWVETVFKYTEKWSYYIEIPVMTNLCRQMIELAESLIAEDALLASALKENILKKNGDGPQDETKIQADMMRKVLNACSKYLYGLTKMLRLRDTYLISITTKIVCKLLERLREFDLEIGVNSRSFIYRTCKITPEGKYEIGTNLTRQQKAELLMALDGDDAEVEIITERKVPEPQKVKKQSKLDLWTKAGVGERSNRDDVLELSSTIDSRRSTLDQIAQRQAKTKTHLAKPVRPAAPKLQPGVSDAARIKALKESRLKAKEEKQRRDREFAAKMKDAQPAAPAIRSEIMVETSEEEEEDSGDEDLDAFMLKQRADLQAQSEAERQRARALLQSHRAPVKKRKQNLTEKDIRARIDPNMGPLHRAILEWDIFHQGVDPPSGIAVNKVSNTYKDEIAYKDTFSPLLLHEAWRSFVTAMEESTSKPFGMKIASRMNFDGFIQVTSSMPQAEKPKERPVSEGDIVVISKSENPLQDREAPHCLSRVHKIQFKQGSLEIEYRVSPTSRTIIPELMPNKVLYVAKITNMTTIEREYATLQGLQHYDLLEEVLEAKPSPILKYSEQAVQSYVTNYSLNFAQATAVLGAKDNDGFTLIQGPPGTGKTKTIVAMVGCLLTGQLAGPTPAPKTTGGSIKKLLVCAPSNAAVDELVLRLKQGVKTTQGNQRNINVIRLGRSDAINAAVKDVTLEELVNRRLEAENVMDTIRSDREKIHAEAAEIKQKVDELWVKVSIARDSGDRVEMTKHQRELDEWKRRQARIGSQLDELKSSGKTVNREIDIKRLQFQREILGEAHVLCATLSGSGHEIFKSLTDVDFETVIIDEAAQCVELSALIPLKYGCVKCILVGDPKQLPPTVLSQSAARFGYDQSLFVRMQRCHPQHVHLLDRQYRMHPHISMFPSREFYEGKLIDGADMASLRQQPWHASTDVFSPYRFFDVKGVQQKGGGGRSLVNVQELNVALQLYERLRTDYSFYDFKRKIGIITPYKAQLFELRNRFASRYGNDITETIEFNTTDAFQGRECEIIIFSCVRASPTGGIGFMTDIRRMNVGLTRAKSSLWILGDSRALVQGEFWNKLIDDARQRKLYTEGDILSKLRQPTQRRDLPILDRSAPVEYVPPPDIPMPDADALNSVDSRPVHHPAPTHRPGSQNGGIPKDVLARRVPSIDSRGNIAPEIPSVVSRPVIHSTTDPERGFETKKRPHDGQDSSGPEPKKTAGPNPPKNLNRPRQNLPKILQGRVGTIRPPGPKPPKPRQEVTDPAAMDSLGLRPPQRPPPPQQPQQPQQPPKARGPPPTGPSAAAPPSGPRPQGPNAPRPPPKKGANVFINKRRPR